MKPKKKRAWYLSIAVLALLTLPSATYALDGEIGVLNTPPGTPSDSDTVSVWEGGNGVTVAISLIRNWFGEGWARSDPTSYGSAPYMHWVVIHCDDDYGNVSVSPQVTGWSASSLYTINVFCDTDEVGSASEHWVWNDPI